MSQNDTKFYIDGAWVAPAAPKLFDVINPATEEVAGRISLGSNGDVDLAVLAARRAFPGYAATTREERLTLLETIIALYEARADELASAMTAEMGSPITFSKEVQTVNALAHFKEMVSVLKTYGFERFMGGTLISREPIGVCGLITAMVANMACSALKNISKSKPCSAIKRADGVRRRDAGHDHCQGRNLRPGPVHDDRSRAELVCPDKLHVDLLGNCQRIIYLDAEIANGAFDLGVPKQQLYRSQITRTTINKGGLGRPQRMHAKQAPVQPNVIQSPTRRAYCRIERARLG